METCDGFLVKRTHQYLFCVANGWTILHSSCLETWSDLNNATNNSVDEKHRIIGDSQCTEWMAPQRAEKQTGTLLRGYTVILGGSFDSSPVVPSTQQRQRQRRSNNRQQQEQQHDSSKDSNVYSKSQLEQLLVLCGGRIGTVASLREGTNSSKITKGGKKTRRNTNDSEDDDDDDDDDATDCVVMVLLRPKPSAKDWRAGSRLADEIQPFFDDAIAVVDGTWLLDSISDYSQPKNAMDYTRKRKP